MNKINVLCLFGGNSTEYEVSCRSFSSVIKNIDREKYNVIEVGIQKYGVWQIYKGNPAKILDLSWAEDEKNLYPCAIVPKQGRDKKAKLVRFENDSTSYESNVSPTSYESIEIDVILPIIHGANGEDGTIQGISKMYEIPCVGADIISSVCSFDKEITKIICHNAGIKQGKYISVRDYEYKKDRENIVADAESELGYPMFIKPANAGSSVGITKARNRGELEYGIKVAFGNDKKAVIEEFVKGREIEVAVLGNDDKLIIPDPGEINPNADFYDYNTKYINDTAKYYIPARLDKETTARIKEIAKKVFTAVGADGFSRIDFFVDDENNITFNEINTIPGFTDISMYAKLMTNKEMTYPELISKMIELAIKKSKTER